MNEHPILFKANMIEAIVDGRKTQTRRLLIPQPDKDCGGIRVGFYHPTKIGKDGIEYPGDTIFGAYADDGEWGWKCPYGSTGDRLWVKRNYFTKKSDALAWLEITNIRAERLQDTTEADAQAEGVNGGCLNCGHLQPCGCGKPTPSYIDSFIYTWNKIYADSCDVLHPYGWYSNPWVWVIEFKVVKE